MIAPFGPTLEMVGKLRPTKSFCSLKNIQSPLLWEEERRGGSEREEERIGKGFLVYVVHMHVQQRELF